MAKQPKPETAGRSDPRETVSQLEAEVARLEMLLADELATRAQRACRRCCYWRPLMAGWSGFGGCTLPDAEESPVAYTDQVAGLPPKRLRLVLDSYGGGNVRPKLKTAAEWSCPGFSPRDSAPERDKE